MLSTGGRGITTIGVEVEMENEIGIRIVIRVLTQLAKPVSEGDEESQRRLLSNEIHATSKRPMQIIGNKRKGKKKKE